ncbi:MAG: hypothetical protein RIQ47_335 [Bacteroidota bacterium]
MKLSVVIVNYNVKYFLEQCLRSVERAGEGISMEVFVVDNNSVDGSVDMVQQKFPLVKLIANKENTGFSRANNQAIRQSSGEYVLLLNPDTVVEEDTFRKVVDFMDAHPDAGGLGVRMIDGSGKFLPESKRGLPTPAVAFYKIFGLSYLFPKSKTFGRYHLGYLPVDKVNEVDVLSGAFMLLRNSVLNKIGLLDEDFFMYGEDIDLSYRIQQLGAKNYYFPDTQIIHYKGESTKKSSVNYVFVFYNAMIIFAKKHFSPSNASLFSFFIKIAIYLRAAMALMMRLFRTFLLPALDFLLLFAGMWLLKEYWGHKAQVHYPPVFIQLVVPAYLIIWLASVYLSGGYDQPIRLQKVIRGLISGTIVILVIYALLPEESRYSRALLLMGAAWASVGMTLLRFLLHFLVPKQFVLATDIQKKLLIVGDADEGLRVLSLLKLSGTQHNFIGFVQPEQSIKSSTVAEYEQFLLGPITKLSEMMTVFRPDEIIFCAKDLSSHEIIRQMSGITGKDVEFKIAPPESMFIIGSSSIDNPGELYVVDLNSIGRTANRRNKRIFDVIVSLLLIVLSPVILLLQRRPSGYFTNLMSVIWGHRTLVGFATLNENGTELPQVRRGILSITEGMEPSVTDDTTLLRLNLLYAKDYQVVKDAIIVLKGLRNLGQRTIE